MSGSGTLLDHSILLGQLTPIALEVRMSQKKEAPAKQPYVKPDFRFEKVFVTTALSCGKTGTMLQCKTAASAS